MKYLIPIFIFFFFSSCTIEDELVLDNIFEDQLVSGLFEDVTLVYLPQDFKVRVSFEVNFAVLTPEQEERLTGLYIDYDGEPRAFDLDRRTFSFSSLRGEICVKLGVTARNLLSNSSIPICEDL